MSLLIRTMSGSLAVMVLCATLGAAQGRAENMAQGQQWRQPRFQPAANVIGAANQLNIMQRGMNMQVRNPGLQSGNIHEPFDGVLTARKIRRAVDDAVLFLRCQQAPDGSMEEYHRFGGGTALGALAMLASGADPESDDSVRRALEWLMKQDMNETYVRAIRANVWEYALRKCPYEERYRKALKADYEWLMKALGDKEGWRYQMGSPDWDNSVTQYGVLGVWAAARAGFEPGDAFWQRMARHFLGCQNDDGGWGYRVGGSSANMATAGLATMFLVFDMHHGRRCYRRENPHLFAKGEAARCLYAIKRGMSWLAANGGSNRDGYYLYGIERTGVAGGRKYIGGHDWFAEGAGVVLHTQARDGSIPMTSGHGGPRIRTAFATLFLVYGGAPVAFSKLQYGEGQNWNLNPRDVANLTKYLWSAYERPLNWHSVGIDAPVEEFEAPILFISGNEKASFSSEEVDKLRQFVERGGTILCEPSDASAEFRKSMMRLLRQMYPEDDYPSYMPAELPEKHGIYTVLKQQWRKLPRLVGASNGSRTFFIISDEYLSADWQMNRTDSDAFKLALNMLFYATDLGQPEGRFASILPETEPAKARSTVAVVATIKHGKAGGHPFDWNAGSVCWRQFAPYFKYVSGVDLETRPAVAPGEDSLEGINVLRITGRHGLSLDAAARKALKDFVARGGTILVDAYAGAADFAESARREIETVFGDLEPLEDAHILAAGRFTGGGDLSRRIRFSLPARRALRARGEKAEGQKLSVVMVDGRPGVVFSEFDLSAAVAGIANYGAAGYRPDSARRILANIVAYASVD